MLTGMNVDVCGGTRLLHVDVVVAVLVMITRVVAKATKWDRVVVVVPVLVLQFQRQQVVEMRVVGARIVLFRIIVTDCILVIVCLLLPFDP